MSISYIEHGVKPYVNLETKNKAILAAIKECSKSRDLHQGRKLHAEILENKYHCHTLVNNSLIHMYVNCGSMVEAQNVFDTMERRTVQTWNRLITGYMQNGESEHALQLMTVMESEGLSPNFYTFVAGFKACMKLAENSGKLLKPEALKRCRELETAARKNSCESDIFVANTMINAYTTCGSIDDGKRIFDGMSSHDVAAWNTLILGYVENNQGEAAWELYVEMRSSNEVCKPDSRTFVAVVKACAVIAAKEKKQMEALEKGMVLHCEAIRYGCSSDIFVCSSLVDMYSRCGSMRDAQLVFEKMAFRNVVSWTALLTGYADNGEEEKVFHLFQFMQTECEVNSRTFIAVLKACIRVAEKYQSENVVEAKMNCLEKGMSIDSYLAGSRARKTTLPLENSLLDMYSKCGSMIDSQRIFYRIQHPDVISWNSLLLGYVNNGEAELTLQLFTEMKSQDRCKPDARTFFAVLRACVSLSVQEGSNEFDGKSYKLQTLELGMDIHSQAMKNGWCDRDIFVQNMLVDMYAKCGSMFDARHAFDRIKKHTVVSWTAIILGYAENGDGNRALEVFLRMKTETRLQDACLYVAALKACTVSTMLEQGKAIHGEILRYGVGSSKVVESSLVDFYGKCGNMRAAEQVFDSTVTGDVVTWTALLAAFSRQGETNRVFELFKQMEERCVRPGGVTFLSLLTACSHAGLVERGREYFEVMFRYGVVPEVNHYHCLMDLLGRTNHSAAALEVIQTMPFQPTEVTWTTLLATLLEERK